MQQQEHFSAVPGTKIARNRRSTCVRWRAHPWWFAAEHREGKMDKLPINDGVARRSLYHHTDQEQQPGSLFEWAFHFPAAPQLPTTEIEVWGWSRYVKLVCLGDSIHSTLAVVPKARDPYIWNSLFLGLAGGREEERFGLHTVGNRTVNTLICGIKNSTKSSSCYLESFSLQGIHPKRRRRDNEEG